MAIQFCQEVTFTGSEKITGEMAGFATTHTIENTSRTELICGDKYQRGDEDKALASFNKKMKGIKSTGGFPIGTSSAFLFTSMTPSAEGPKLREVDTFGEGIKKLLGCILLLSILKH